MKQSTTDDRMTGKVGTAMYVAPELGNAKSRIKFSQKVDMYSLGVILFEMFYRPLETGMERVMVLSDIRAVSQLLDHYLQYYFHLLYDLAIWKDQIGRKTDLCDMSLCVNQLIMIYVSVVGSSLLLTLCFYAYGGYQGPTVGTRPLPPSLKGG